MLLVTHGSEAADHAGTFKEMFQLRAKQFSTRRGWSVDVQGGLERDRFDDLNPLYICVLGHDRKLLASLRLLPTTGPHMLSDVFPEVMGEAGIVRHPLIWESSRFCVDTDAARKFSTDGVNDVTRQLLAGLFETAHSAGVHNIVSVYDVFVERILRRAGCSFDRLGPVVKYDDLKTVGGLFEVSKGVIGTLSARFDQVALIHVSRVLRIIFGAKRGSTPSGAMPTSAIEIQLIATRSAREGIKL